MRLASHSARRRDSDENHPVLYGGGGKFKKFSGWQVGISKKLFTNDVHPPGRGSGANRLVNFMARLRLSRLSATEMGAARRVSFLRLHH